MRSERRASSCGDRRAPFPRQYLAMLFRCDHRRRGDNAPNLSLFSRNDRERAVPYVFRRWNAYLRRSYRDSKSVQQAQNAVGTAQLLEAKVMKQNSPLATFQPLVASRASANLQDVPHADTVEAVRGELVRWNQIARVIGVQVPEPAICR